MHEERSKNTQVSRGTPRLTLMTPKAASALQSSLSIPLTLHTEDMANSSSAMASRTGSKSVSASVVYGMESKRGSMEDLRVAGHATSGTASIPVRKKKEEESLLLANVKKKEYATPAREFCEERLAVASKWSRYRRVKAEIEYAYTQGDEAKTKSEYAPEVKRELVPKPSIVSDYRIIKTVGTGSTGKVKLAEHVLTKEQVAIKMIPRIRSTRHQKSKETIVSRERRILREAATLYLLEHSNIVGLKDLLVTEDYFFLLFEYIQGEELLDHIVARKKLSERRAKNYFAQLLGAVAYCHANGVVHRDLKIENILIVSTGAKQSTSPDSNLIKLVDFGLSNFYNPREKLTTYCGSLYFAAPELLSGKPYCGPEVDVWSLGVILYVMLCGKVPFDDKSLNTLHTKIKKGTFEIPSDLSSPVKDILRSMMCVDPVARIRINQLMNHPWLKDAIPRSYPCVGVPIDKPDDAVLQHLLEEFAPLQFGGVPGILDTFRRALTEWASIHDHPLIKLYHLTAAKLKKHPKPAVGTGERSKSDGELNSAVMALELNQPQPALTRVKSYSFLDQVPVLAMHPPPDIGEGADGLLVTNAGTAPRIHRRSIQNNKGQKKSSWWRCSIQ